MFEFLAASQAVPSWVSDVLFIMFIDEISRCWRALRSVHFSDITVTSCFCADDFIFLVSIEIIEPKLDTSLEQCPVSKCEHMRRVS